jgi:uncharacterized repeat protein (TIGR03803 family)
MSSSGGSKGYGTIYVVGTDGSGFSVLHGFSNSPDGGTPEGGMVDSENGKVIGMAASGGTRGYGVAFSMGTDGSGFTNIYNFTGGDDGATPVGAPAMAGENVIGMTSSGGSKGYGVVFNMETDGSNFSVLHTFTNSPDGGTPTGAMVASDNGKVIGMAASGGTRGYGILLSMGIDGSGATNLYNFSGGTDGGIPVGTPINDASGNVIGMTSSGGLGYGVVFSYTPTNSLRLTQVVSSNALILQWLPPAMLQQSANLLNWGDLSNATSPYQPPLSGAQQFFRLRQPQ